jgi:hypothetical protein
MNEENKDNIEHKTVRLSLTVHMEPPSPPPPPGFTSPFKSLNDWLFYLCDVQQEKSIADLQFSLDDSPGNSMLSVEGFNKFDVDKDVVEYRIDFKPAHQFFPLSKEEYGRLSIQQLRTRVSNELIEFIKSDKFRNSFLAKTDSIRINFSDPSSRKLK